MKKWKIFLIICCVFFTRIDCYAAKVAILPPPQTTSTPFIPPPKWQRVFIYEHPYRKPIISRVYTSKRRTVISSLPESYDADLHQIWPYIPHPKDTITFPKKLTLQDAILLALRYNPNVEDSEIQRIVDKYNIILEHYNFEPQFTFSQDSTYSSGATPVTTMNATAALKTMVGTSFDFAYTNSFEPGQRHGNATFTITQPLLRGFGYVARIPWLDTLDNELIARLTFQTQIISSVIAVITSYRTLVGDYNSLDIQKQNLKVTQQTVNQFKLEVKIGKLAASDLNQQLANLQNARLNVNQVADQLQDDYQAFLAAVGLIPAVKVNIEKEIHFRDVSLPSLMAAIHMALKHNQAYQQAVIGLRSSKRAIASARDGRKPELNLVYTRPIAFDKPALAGGGDGGDGGLIPLEPVPGPITPTTFAINFTFPIDDVPAKSALINAEVSYEKAKIALEQQKENLIRTVMTQYRSLQIQKQSIEIAEKQVEFQEQTLRDARIKFRFGKVTMFEVIQDQNQLLSSRTALVTQKIQYLNLITTFYQTLGITLDKWHIQLRY